MAFQVRDQVVHPAHGMGRISGLVTRQFAEAAAGLYYEVALARGTLWVPIRPDTTDGLRPITPAPALSHYRQVLKSQPVALHQDHRQRRTYLLGRLKRGLFQDLCDVVRDLTARGWAKPLGELDAAFLHKTRESLNEEWAASEGVPLPQAIEEINALLLEGQRTHQG